MLRSICRVSPSCGRRRAVREAVGRALRALPGFGNPLPQAQIPPELADYLVPLEARAYPDTGTGSCADVIGRRLKAGWPLGAGGAPRARPARS